MVYPIRILLLFALYSSLLLPARADAPATYQLIRIMVPDREVLDRIFESGIDFEGSSGRIGGWMEFVAGAEERRQLDLRGVAYETVDDDLARTMSYGLAPGPLNALGFGYGSMGGYYTYSEVAQQLDSMKLLYPGLITARQTIGVTDEGRAIWAVKISDNPGEEEDEPGVLFTALHHAREPAGMMSAVYYMWWLLEQYGSDPDATYLVDNRQIWFIPVVNPDGYVYNETTNPSGGGMWRKNRHNNGLGSFGVDLNRNYGPEYMWNSPNGGSSTVTGSETYRGTSPFSEAETQAVTLFLLSHQIGTCLNYHTSGRLLIYPYGYLGAESGDSLIYREYAFDMVRHNRYASGTDQQTVHYNTRGNSDDFMYGDTTKFRTFAMTPEVGSSFWPASELILPLVQENLPMNIHASYVAGQKSVLDGWAPDSATSSDGFLPGGPFSFSLRLMNRGLVTAGPLSVSFSSDSPWIGFTGTTVLFDSLAGRMDTTIGITGTLSPGAPEGSAGRIFVDISDPAGYFRRDTVSFFTGQPHTIFHDDAGSGTGSWSAGGTWSTSFDTGRGSLVFDDSPAGSYASGADVSLQTADPLNLAGYTGVTLSFDTRWAIEPTWDFARIEVSTNGGGTWVTVGSDLSNPGSGFGAQTAGTLGYDGYTPGLRWVRQEVDLSPFTVGGVLLRFRLITDGADVRDGWRLDDITVTGYRSGIPGSNLTLTGTVSGGRSLFFGEIAGATDGLDTLLGESELSPLPPADSFDVRWEIPGTEGSAMDLKSPLGSPDDTNTFRLLVQAAADEYPLLFGWERNLLAPGGWRIRDGATGGTIFDHDMWKTGHVYVTDTALTSIEIIHRPFDSAAISYDGGWNMLSLPAAPDDGSVGSLFPDAASSAFSFDGAYGVEDSLVPGRGYWLKFGGTGNSVFEGTPFSDGTVENPTGGWVLFGIGYCPLAVGDICPSCVSPPLIYGYRNGYYTPDTLLPGTAYWYRGSEPLDISCDAASTLSAKRSRARSHVGDFNTLEISDRNGGTTRLYFRSTDGSPGAVEHAPLPPPPPGGAFDARFDTHAAGDYVSVPGESTPRGIVVTSSGSDILVTYRRGITERRRFEIVRPGSGGPPLRIPLEDGSTVLLGLPPDGRFGLRAVGTGPVPSGFRVYGNYPNPFNPSTTVRFDLPFEAEVSLTLHNVLGERVGTPPGPETYSPGTHTLRIDAGDLPAGTYFYRVTAVPSAGHGAVSSTGKFIIVR